MELSLIFVVLGMVVIGAIAQRVAGLGFAMLVSPFLVIMLGAHEGVFLVNICGVVSSAIIMPRVYRDIDWSMFRWLCSFSVIGSIIGALLAGALPSAPLSIVVGAVVLAALLLSLILSRANVTVRGQLPKSSAGFLSGLTNAMAGVGGPAVSAYAVLARWPQRPFAATLQPFFVVTGLISIGMKFITTPAALPAMPPWAWIGVAVFIWVGVFIGERVQRVVSDKHARFFVLCIAFLGAITALISGLRAL
ncbi:sulfite exporter TauE/SafE family protein [Paeniglutamicibacter terrestris]|uniref:Probable membrane transporter protein n=1 Tax=Paeniglutamicibacter terrestris TaxID=2723403 RepID=A0ABX1G4Z1_9MICC|nr:sulfite exporter TauE/SafE family protein [Paeniglutamicibacter terrestris]ASN40334.1 sulfite transporter TauE/SafE [Arthrobacter sp. 7749]NKG21322.1 sulfite exporter TauE/SafE family protein [Paeniglutamicibacter terrestris]